MLGIQTWGGRMEGANESTELQRHPNIFISLCPSFFLSVFTFSFSLFPSLFNKKCDLERKWRRRWSSHLEYQIRVIMFQKDSMILQKISSSDDNRGHLLFYSFPYLKNDHKRKNSFESPLSRIEWLHEMKRGDLQPVWPVKSRQMSTKSCPKMILLEK